MEEEEARQKIKQIRESIEKIKSQSKEGEKALIQEVKVLQNENDSLITGIKARMQLIDTLKRDITRMAFEQGLKNADERHEKIKSQLICWAINIFFLYCKNVCY